MAKKIEIRIAPGGKMKVETSGFKGCGCQEATKFLENMGKVADEVLKDEFYEHPEEEREFEGG